MHLDIKGPIGAAGPGKVDVFNVVILDEDRRFVHENESSLQGVHEAGGGLVGAGDGGRTGVTDKLTRHGDLAAGEHLHEAGHQLEGRALHLLLKFPFVLLL